MFLPLSAQWVSAYLDRLAFTHCKTRILHFEVRLQRYKKNRFLSRVWGQLLGQLFGQPRKGSLSQRQGALRILYVTLLPIPINPSLTVWRIFHFFLSMIQVSQVTSGPRRGPTFNNRWWNDRRSWNLRITDSREKASPKGANHIQSCSCSPPSGTIREHLSLSAGSIPFGHSTRGYSHSPPSGTVECYLRNFRVWLFRMTDSPNVYKCAKNIRKIKKFLC